MNTGFRKSFEVLCFVVDRNIMTGRCTYDETISKFGSKMINDFIYNKKIIKKFNKEPFLLDLTEIGRHEIKS